MDNCDLKIETLEFSISLKGSAFLSASASPPFSSIQYLTFVQTISYDSKGWLLKNGKL